jgi:hypothetical protein
VVVPGIVGDGGGSTVTTLKPPRGPDGTPLPPAPPITTPVPEPQTWALMLMGLAAGALLRRRAVGR